MISPDDDLIAAEYALGTLDAAERAAAAARRMTDGAFDAAIGEWETRLAALDDAAAEADPSPSVWRDILARIEALDRPAETVVAIGSRVARLQRQLILWRTGAAAAVALAAALALWIAVAPPAKGSAEGTQLVAFLQRSSDAPAFVMGVDLRDDRLAVRPIAATAPAGKAYELWVIDPSIGAPRSLGLIDAPLTSRAVPASIPRDVLARATYAVTVENPGGSPTGAPTSAPVFFGHLVQPPR